MKQLMIFLTLFLSMSAHADDKWKDSLQLDVGHPRMFHLRSNLLYDVLLVPNFGMEFSVGPKMTMLVDGSCGWWGINSKHRYWRVATGQFELRYWKDWVTNAFRYRGHHFGVYAALYRYDLEFGSTGYQADINFGCGLSWGYALKLNSSLSLDFSVGLGYIGGKYIKYTPDVGKYMVISTVTRHYLGPSKLEATLVWHLELKKKGGYL